MREGTEEAIAVPDPPDRKFLLAAVATFFAWVDEMKADGVSDFDILQETRRKLDARVQVIDRGGYQTMRDNIPVWIDKYDLGPERKTRRV